MADSALPVFLKARLGTANGEAVQCFLHRKCLIRQVRAGSVQRAACNRALDSRHHIRQFHGAVRSIGNRHTVFHQGLPVITGLSQFRRDQLRNDVIIVVQENGLCIDMHIKIPDSLQLVGTGNLAVHHTMPVVPARMILKGKLNRIKHLVETGIPDGMNCNLHIVCIGVRHHFIHMVSGKKAEAPIVLLPGIGDRQTCRTAAQGTVSQHFERSDPEEVTPGTCYISGFH